MQGDNFASVPGWDHGRGRVALHTSTSWALISLSRAPNYVVLVLGNEGGGPHHMQACHIRGLGIGVWKLVVLTSNIRKMFN